MDWGISIDPEETDSSQARDGLDLQPSTPVKLNAASTNRTPPKDLKSVLQAKTLLARMRLAQRQEIAGKRKEFKKWAAEAIRAEKTAAKSISSAGRLQQLAEARRRKAEIAASKKLFKSNEWIANRFFGIRLLCKFARSAVRLLRHS
jgi:hypothetical protein